MFFSFVGIILSISRNNWFIVWLGFELNMFCILPFFKETKKKGMELYYFIVQVIGTLFLLWGCILKFNSLFGLIGLFIKLGFFPFFWWVPLMVSKLNWFAIYILTVIQKIPSLFLIRWFDIQENQILIIGMFTLRVRIIGMYNSVKSLKLLFGWSSVIKTSLAIQLIVLRNSFICLCFFLLYSIISLYCCLCFYKSKFNSLRKLIKLRGKELVWLFKGLLSLFFFTGIPQLGFIYKVMFFSGITNLNLEWLVLIWLVINIFFQVVVYVLVFKIYFLVKDLVILVNYKYNFIFVFLYFGFLPILLFIKV